MKKVLITASVPSMIGQFNMNNLHILLDLGYEIHIGCNFKDRSIWNEERIREFLKEMNLLGIKCHQIDFSRNPVKLYSDYKAYTQIDKLLSKARFEFIHCHTPTAGVITRIAAKAKGVRTIYTAHGFHFYKGAPLKNWLLYFPVEWILSFFTDVLITINKEDYTRAKKYMKAKKIEYVPGVGIDLSRFSGSLSDEQKQKKKMETGIPSDAKIILSVGELNENKNHEIIIRVLAKLKNKKIHYVIAGIGNLKNYLSKLSKELGVENNVHLIGFRNDIAEIYKISDIFVHPSFREGLPVALMEAMASGLPCVVSSIRGNVDLIENHNDLLCNPCNENQFANAILKLISDFDFYERVKSKNIIKVKSFTEKNVIKK